MQATNIKQTAQPATARSETQWDPSIEDVALRQSFEAPYINASMVVELHGHILRCWREYCQEDPTRQRSPYIQLMQSRGFGKSRLLRELAVMTSRDQATEFSMRLLYVCAADDSKGITYPRKTAALRDYLFPPQRLRARILSWDCGELMKELASRLVELFDYASEESSASGAWGTIGEKWLGLFEENQRVDEDIVKCLRERAPSYDRTKSVEDASMCPSHRVLLLAIDDADCVWPHPVNGMLDWSHMLRRALVIANQEIQERFGSTGGVFAILTAVDHPTTSPLSSVTGSSSLSIVRPSVKPFAPFILTHTMDLFHKQAFDQWMETTCSRDARRSENWGAFH